jgi:glycosyltransferase involved in cell wall biosynthesis
MSRIAMFVFNDATHDSRVLREAQTLRASGHDVTLVAMTRQASSKVVERGVVDGIDLIRVPVPRGWRRTWTWVRWPWLVYRRAARALPRSIAAGPRGWSRAALIIAVVFLCAPWLVIRGAFYVALSPRRQPDAPPGVVDWLLSWRLSAMGWARDAARLAPVADVYHGHDLHGLAAAARARAEHGGALVYDSHEIFLESGTNARRPAWARRWFARLERRWVARADALVTVNDALAIELGRRYRPRRTVVVHNCPPRWDPPSGRVDALRGAAGITDGAPVALYHGGFSAHRGLEEFVQAILEPGLERVHAVFLGYGREQAGLERLAHEARFGGRVHVLEAVLPEALVEFISTADVGVMPIQPSTLNHILSTPNKLFECLAAGVPVVVSDLPEMRRIVLDDPDGPLGTVCDPTSPASIARAIQMILDRPAAEVADLRARCLGAAHARWNWETEVTRLLALYDDLVGPVAR